MDYNYYATFITSQKSWKLPGHVMQDNARVCTGREFSLAWNGNFWLCGSGLPIWFFEARFWNSGFFCKSKKARKNLALLAFFCRQDLALEKHLSELRIDYKSSSEKKSLTMQDA